MLAYATTTIMQASNICNLCDRTFTSRSGLTRHKQSCEKRQHDTSNNSAIERILNSEQNIDANDSDHLDVTNDNNTNDVSYSQNLSNSCKPNLPEYTKISFSPKQPCNSVPGAQFVEIVENVYNEIVKWRKNLYKLPSGNSAKLFIRELTYWLEQFNNDMEYQCIALKVFMILPCLLLQKPSRNSKAKDHALKLNERLGMWKDGKIMDIMSECRQIQHQLKSGKQRTSEDTARIFSKLVFSGKINAALKFLSSEADNGVLDLNDATMKELSDKHPEPSPISEETLLSGPIRSALPSYFERIDDEMIKTAARQTKGATGPSQLDADQYRHMLTSLKYKKEAKEIREQIAILSRKLATTVLDPSVLEAYTACRLIPLNKDPGVRPIGVGEILRRIIGKAVSWVLKLDVQKAAGPLQAATGLKGGAEAAIHAMREIFQHDETDAIILVDASNAFNRLKRMTALHNIQYLVPEFATILINTYRQPSRLFVTGGKELSSKEGTTQGDNLAMAFYALATVPLQDFLRRFESFVQQVWLADDATGAGKLTNLRKWWDIISTEGPKSGYYVNAPKSWLILKDPAKLNYAKELFEGTCLNITTAGKRHLGAAAGSEDFRKEYATKKVNEWVSEIEKLSKYAESQPHAAFAAYVHGEQSRFTYFMRTIPEMEAYITPLDDIINGKLLPSILGISSSALDREVYSLPIRNGGLGMPILAQRAKSEFDASQRINAPLAAIIMLQGLDLPDEIEQKELRAQVVSEKSNECKQKITSIKSKVSISTQRAIEQASQPGASSWLSARPLTEQGTTLNKSEFRDAIALRYNKPIKNLPERCPCGQPFNASHAMDCKRGGFITIRHNNIRDFEAKLLEKVSSDVEVEPVLQPIRGEKFSGRVNESDEARADIRARGFWRKGQSAFFDIRVTNTNCPSQVNQPVEKIYRKHENEKKREYNERIMQIEHGSFTPLVFSIHGGMAPECLMYHKLLADKIAEKTNQRYEKVMAWIRAKLSFIIIRSALLCLRGTRRNSDCSSNVVEDFALACDELGL